MTPLAHIAGIPVEETALSFGPVLLAGGGIAAMKLREHLRRIRRQRRVRIRRAPAAPRRSA